MHGSMLILKKVIFQDWSLVSPGKYFSLKFSTLPAPLKRNALPSCALVVVVCLGGGGGGVPWWWWWWWWCALVVVVVRLGDSANPHPLMLTIPIFPSERRALAILASQHF